MRTRFLSLLLLLFAASVVRGQCTNPETENCTVQGALNFYRAKAGVTQVEFVEVKPEVAKAAIESVEDKVKNANRATTPPDAFAGRLHNSYQDFLNLLSFAINDVKESEDGRALVIRFNPKRAGRNMFGLTLTAAEPGLSDDVKKAIPDATRDDVVRKLDGQLGDTDDLTWAGSYSYSTNRCDTTVDPRDWCWGRAKSTYRDLLSGLVVPPDLSMIGLEARLTDELTDLFKDEVVTIKGAKLDQLKKSTDRPQALEIMQKIVENQKAMENRTKLLSEKRHLALLADLIDNQPQLTATATYRDPGDLGGPIHRAATLEFHIGRQNLNTVRKSCGASKGAALNNCLLGQLASITDTGISTDKIVVVATYSQNRRFQVATLPLEPAVADFTPVDVKSTREINVKVQGGRQLSTEVMGQSMRADLSIEGIRTEKDSKRTKNRWVGTLTLSVPIGDNMTVPFSVMYANRSEFLDEKSDKIGAHLGISYRLPELFGKKK
jgi:hypothetical protein